MSENATKVEEKSVMIYVRGVDSSKKAQDVANIVKALAQDDGIEVKTYTKKRAGGRRRSRGSGRRHAGTAFAYFGFAESLTTLVIIAAGVAIASKLTDVAKRAADKALEKGYDVKIRGRVTKDGFSIEVDARNARKNIQQTKENKISLGLRMAYDEDQVLRAIKNIHNSGIKTYLGVARELNNRGYRNINGGAWNAQAVKDLILNK